MADNDNRIRVILEGIDKLSSPLNNAAKSVEKFRKEMRMARGEFPLFGGGYAKLNEETGKFERVLTRSEKSLQSYNKTLGALAKQIDNVKKSLTGTPKNAEIWASGIYQDPDSKKFVRALTIRENALKKYVESVERIRRGLRGTPQGVDIWASGVFQDPESKQLRRQLTIRENLLKNYVEAVERVRRKLSATPAKVEIFATGVYKDPDTGQFRRVLTVRENLYNRSLGKLIVATRNAAAAIGEALSPITNQTEEIADDVEDGFRRAAIISIKTSREIKKGFSDFATQFGKAFALSSKIPDDVRKNIEDFTKWRQDKINEIAEQEDKARSKLLRDLKEEQAIMIDGINEERAERRALQDELKTEKDKARKEELQAQIDAINKEIQLRREEFRIIKRERLATNAREFQEARTTIRTTSRGEFIADALTESTQAAREEIEKLDNSLERLGRKAGFNFGEMVKGIRVGRAGIEEITEVVKNSGNRFTQFGLNVGDATRSIGAFVNLRWLFITGIVSLFFSIIIRLGAALVALASSAGVAAAALSGAFAAAVSQLVPVVGLLAATMNRLKLVMDAVAQDNKNRLSAEEDAKEAAEKRATAVEKLADAQWSLKLALEGVTDAEYELKQSQDSLADAEKARAQAVKDLADARVQAKQDIIDANLEERSAALGLAEAELAVLDAKERLRKEQEKRRGGGDVEAARLALKEAQERLKIVKEQGDQAEISAAQQQVTIARQNLSAIQDQAAETENSVKNAQLAVERAELNREQAVVRNIRAKADAKKKRTQGIENSELVVNAKEQLVEAGKGVEQAQRGIVLANRQVRNSLRQVTEAQKELTAARKEANDLDNFKTTGQKNLEEQLADFSPSEKKLFNSFKRLREAYQRIFSGTPEKDGILGPINEAIARATDTLLELLTDPKIIKALTGLSAEIGKSIDAVAKFAISPEFKEFLVFIIDEGTKNLPLVTDAFINLANAFVDIATAGAPLFRDLLERFTGFTETIEKTTGNREDLEEFFGSAAKHLDAWIDFGKAFVELIVAIGKGAAPSGLNLLKDITSLLDDWSQWLNDNPEETEEFFNRLIKSFENLAVVIGKTLPQFVKAFSSDNYTAFVEVFLDVIVPGLLIMIEFLGLASKALSALFNIPIAGDILKFFVQLAVAEKALNKLFPVSQKLTVALRALAIKGFGALLFGFNPLKLAEFTTILTNWTSKIPIIGGLLTRVLVPAIKAVGIALRFAFGPWGLLIAAIVTGIVLLDRKFHFLRPTINFLWKLIRRVYEWIKSNWRLLAVIIAGPFGLAITFIVRHFNTIKNIILKAFNFIKQNWRIFAVLVSPIALAVLFITRHFEKIKKIIANAWNVIKLAGQKYYEILISPFVKFNKFVISLFKKLPGVIKDALSSIPGIIEGLIKRVPGGKYFLKALGGVKDAASGIAGFVSKATSVAADQLGLTAPKNKDDGGLIQKGNIDLSNRKPVKNKDGTVSTIRSITIGTDKGYYVIPTIVGGKKVSDKKAIEYFSKTGEHLGLFETQAQADAFARKLHNREAQKFGIGGIVAGSASKGIDSVPALLTPGEWVLNLKQQKMVAKAFGMTLQQARAHLFGTNTGTKPPGSKKPGSSYMDRPEYFSTGVTLVNREDPDGVNIWFVEMADKTFGQVTARDAKRIRESAGRFIPNYVKRSSAGFTQLRPRPFALGGVVPMPAVQRFAEGGVVQSPGFGDSNSTKNITQNFEVKTQGETDWNYVLRLGAISAQGSF
jgi:ABC-type multidrug transport system fused ATPase/permease subunit